MGRSSFPFLLLCFFALSAFLVCSYKEGSIKAEVSNKGLDFLKDLLIEKAESDFIPLELPYIEKHVKIPLLGTAQMVLADIFLERIRVSSSSVKTGDDGMILGISGGTANLTMNWEFIYNTWLLPITVSDKGTGSVQVEGLEVGLTLSLKARQGSLKLSLLDCWCDVTDVTIIVDGGASSLYKRLVAGFAKDISSAFEVALSNKINDSIIKLDMFLQSIPKEVPLSDVAAMNITFLDDLELINSSLRLSINGLLSPINEAMLSTEYSRSGQTSLTCKKADKMVKFSFREDVLESASSVYFEAGKMHWIVNRTSDLPLLNTDWWKFIIPQLYNKYPNCNMNLNLTISSQPTIEVGNQQITTTIPLDVVVNVMDAEEVVSVALISTVINTSISPMISGNVLAGSVKLHDFSMSLRWSKIGRLHMILIQAITSATLKDVILPYVNLKLSTGLNLPVFHGYKLHDAQILCTDSWIVVFVVWCACLLLMFVSFSSSTNILGRSNLLCVDVFALSAYYNEMC